MPLLSNLKNLFFQSPLILDDLFNKYPCFSVTTVWPREASDAFFTYLF